MAGARCNLQIGFLNFVSVTWDRTQLRKSSHVSYINVASHIIMKYRLLTIFLLTTIISSGQTIAPFKDTDFSADKFVVKKEQWTLGIITVDLIHAKPKKQDDSRQFSCRTWLTIKDKNKLIKELAQDADAVGGCSGLFFPDSQPNKDLIIISKFGDYDGRLYVVNSK